ncbi:hypothetical protein [Helicobacter rodentium]|uniref:hypothetical protein n=1 Tax=Helicobacter rodentium TaxID=59617 RepID=UPI0023F1CECF|nr:hypothetical protein [Helicobacter rodentium]
MFLLILCGDAIIGFCNYENSNTIPLMQNLIMTRWGAIWNLLSMFDYGLLRLMPCNDRILTIASLRENLKNFRGNL